MPTTTKIGWLKDKNGENFAPKTLISQVQASDGTLLEHKLTENTNLIVAAKETADAALPKSGGTMTGELKAVANNTGATPMVRNMAYGSESELASLASASNNGTILIYTS